MTCCDLHGRNCEPPSELCCESCTEWDHPDHRHCGPCSNPDLSARLLPAESIALTVAKAQVERGDDVTPNVVAVLMMALERLVSS